VIDEREDRQPVLDPLDHRVAIKLARRSTGHDARLSRCGRSCRTGRCTAEP
jgi:hypothetical protein